MDASQTDPASFWTVGGLIPGDLPILRAAVAAQNPPASAHRPNAASLVILCGLPGTGKSHFAKALTACAPFLWINSDLSRKRLVRSPGYTREEHQRVFAAMHALTAELLSAGRPVIFDATNLNETVRQPLYAIAERANIAPVLIRFVAPPAVIRRRLAKRANGAADASGSDADWTIYSRMAPADAPIPRPHLLVRHRQDVAPTLRETLRRTGFHPHCANPGNAA